MGECDYIVIIPKKGLVCIEIKSCREPYPKITNQGWFYNFNQEEKNEPDVDGPFVQVKNFTQDLKRDLTKYAAFFIKNRNE